MDKILQMTETKSAKLPVKKKKSKYTDEQKAAAISASKLVEELNDLMKQVVARNETR